MKYRPSIANLCPVSLLLTSTLSFAQSQAGQPITISNPIVHTATHFDISKPLRELIKTQSAGAAEEDEHGVLLPKRTLQQGFTATGRPVFKDPVLQSRVTTPTTATVGVNVLGVGVGFPNYEVNDVPPDPNLAVGDTQVVEWVNVSYAVFDKTTGAILAGPILGNALWQGFGGRCENSNSGDIIAQWDKVAHRWVLHQPVFAFPYASCFAISTTPDALGTYFRYSFPQTAGFPDYPKLGIWTDTHGVTNGYYQANNIFADDFATYLGAMPCAYERAKMLVGDSSAKQICIFDNSGGTLFDDSMIPADLDSQFSLPPAGTDEVFLGSIDNFASETHVYEYVFHVDYSNPANSTLTGVNGSMPITVAQFIGACDYGANCIPQLGTSSKLDSLGDRLMYRLGYRKSQPPPNVQSTVYRPIQSWVISHAIESNGPTSSGMRWYEFRSPVNNSTALSVFQQGTYAPDANYRWMGSIAMDKVGNILLGYSSSSATIYPAINFAGRSPSDPAGTLGAEGLIFAGTGSQNDNSANRWGDYTSMAIDNNGCTFWYVDEYYTVPNSSFAWSTRVASLSFPDCH